MPGLECITNAAEADALMPVHRRLQRLQLMAHYLIGFASTFTNRPDRSVCVDALGAIGDAGAEPAN